nr:MAG TPA: hypothetical protein [Caudoviricetes sp.]
MLKYTEIHENQLKMHCKCKAEKSCNIHLTFNL